MNQHEPKIYLLPNLMTAGNLFCGFAAILKIIEASLLNAAGEPVAMRYHMALAFILGACVFDLLDGRLARLGGQESPFGQEFDSLADIVSFGLAPALLVYQIVLQDFHRTGWIIAFIYLLCGGLRLARFNCLATTTKEAKTKREQELEGTLPDPDFSSEFSGFPIPAAAGVIASLTLFMLWINEGQRTIGSWKFALPPILLFLSFMMFSHVKYPSFKGLNWHSQRSLPRFLITILVLIFAAVNYEWMPAVLFMLFLLYGFVRPFLSKPLRDEIEEEVISEDNVE
ncbi:MAG: CDP-diacylglycerol--serine O-phosphatidyltransferase [Chthoniobacterales bacterium]|nr:CDP-diacylglycerol--serine O-phosphatidyltransferase [Chthoniobacterales bacterium]